MKQYYCDFDKSVFSNEDDLIKHIRENYVNVMEDKSEGVSSLLDVLNESFPDWKVNIEDGQGWYADYVIYLKNDNTKIAQYYGTKNSDYTKNPDNISNLIKEINLKLETISQVTELAEKLFYNLEYIKCTNYAYGYSEDEHSYKFAFKFKDSNEVNVEELYPYSCDIEDFMNEIKKYNITSLEGKPNTYYDNGYFADYTIDGIKIEAIMTRNKKVKLEIIEM